MRLSGQPLSSRSVSHLHRPKLVAGRIWLAFGTVFCALSAAQPAAILGSILDDSGKPVLANVRISKLGGSSIKGGPPTSVGARTAVDGTFGFPGLSAGTYVMCAQALAGNYLDPCVWSVSPPTASVATGQLIKGFVIVARKGYQRQHTPGRRRSRSPSNSHPERSVEPAKAAPNRALRPGRSLDVFKAMLSPRRWWGPTQTA